MKCGGNSKCADFFNAQADIHEGMALKDKYNTRGAALYRDKIATEAKGEVWSAERSPARSWVPPAPRSISGGMGSGGISAGGGGAGSVSSGSDATFGNGMTVNEMKQSTDTYFAKVTAANASRPDNLPPSQGGKYGGFGNSASAPVKQADPLADALSNLTDGLQIFGQVTTRVASEAVSSIQSNVIDPTREKLADNDIWGSIQQAAVQAGSSIQGAAVQAGESIKNLTQKSDSRGRRRGPAPSADGDDFFANFGQGNSSSARQQSGGNGADDAGGDDDWGDDFGKKIASPARSQSGSRSQSGGSTTPRRTKSKNSKPKGGWKDDDDWGNDW